MEHVGCWGMYIQTQLCSIAIMVLLIFFFKRHKILGLFSERVFWYTLMITIFSVSMDFLSLIAISMMNTMEQFYVDMFCKTYLVTLVFVSFSALSYAWTDMLNHAKYMRYWRIFAGITMAESVVIYILPIQYHVASDEVYTLGPAVLCTYAFTVLDILATLFCCVWKKHKMNPLRRRAVIWWMNLWVLSAAVQLVNNQILVVGFASGLGMLILFCTLENPESNRDRMYGCYHMHALQQYFRERFENKESMSILYVNMVAQQSDSSNREMDETVKAFVDFVKAKNVARIFKGVGNELVLVFDNMTEMNNTFREIQDELYRDHFYEIRNVHERKMPITVFVLLPDSSVVRTPDEIFSIFNHLNIENHDITNTVVSYVNSVILDSIRRDEKAKNLIIEALDTDRVEVFFQPIYSTAHGKFISAEALVRIRTVTGQIVSPNDFIPVAEKTGLILPLGERIFEKTCEFLSQSNAIQLGLDYIEINLSVVQCEQNNLANHYLGILEKYHVDPYRINLEITETGNFNSKATLLDNMKALIAKGVTFSLDDFGNGQSNLDYMIDMPVSVMKLDMNSTKAYFNDLKARFVVQSTVKLAHDLDLVVVAEGVESQAEFEEMIRLGVDDNTGYFFSRPLDRDAFIRFLQEKQGDMVVF